LLAKQADRLRAARHKIGIADCPHRKGAAEEVTPKPKQSFAKLVKQRKEWPI